MDPCHGTFKYLEVTYTCVEKDPNVMFQVTCEHGDFSVSCSSGKNIKVLTANYGRTDKQICQTMHGRTQWESTTCYGRDSEEKLKEL